MLSTLPSYTGMRECPVLRMSAIASCGVASAGMHFISTRGVITSRAIVSVNSKMDWIISFSCSSITPCSSPASTSTRNSSSLTTGANRCGWMPNGRKIRRVSVFTSHTGSASTRSMNTIDAAMARATRSG